MAPSSKNPGAAKPTTFSMPVELLKRLDRVSKITGMPKSKIVQQGTEIRLQQMEKQL